MQSPASSSIRLLGYRPTAKWCCIDVGDNDGDGGDDGDVIIGVTLWGTWYTYPYFLDWGHSVPTF